ncbi:methylmalonyl-CoA carboxytransferase subunit 5S [Pirellulales bacterium]|nr:methylmalonyl-CoA carboxytransferase subunit 5S [Pirellulales bacterium]
MPRTVEVTELCLRDGHQSLLATRMAMEDMTPICEEIDQAGYWSAECWGGATYDACIRFLNEDPWERLREFRRLMPNTRLQMLLRGQNLLGYRHYEDSVVDRFVDKAAENGMDVFRVFDALNDIRNLRRALEAVRRTGKHAEGTISYTISPLHTIDKFVEMAVELRDLGCDSICIKDMAALLRPQAAYELVRGIKQACGEETLVHVHVHATTGVTLVSLMKAIEAGADIVDASISSLSLGPGHNPTEAVVEMLAGSDYQTRLDSDRLRTIKEHFAKVRPRYAEFESKFGVVEPQIFDSQIPGGMLSNMESQLREQGAGDRVEEVLAQVPRVRKVAGYPPLVTPSSQIVGTQAVLNVIMGEFKTLTGEFADLMLGYYGSTLGKRDKKIVAAAAAHAKKEVIDCRPADLLEPEWEDLRGKASALEGCNQSDEDVLTYAMFPQVAPKFFASRAEGPRNVSAAVAPSAGDPTAAAPAVQPTVAAPPVDYHVKIGQNSHRVTVERV